jgi:hypothetical protein
MEKTTLFMYRYVGADTVSCTNTQGKHEAHSHADDRACLPA